ncbi:MAG: DUF6431 domain-containing protein [Limnochordia bacterium]
MKIPNIKGQVKYYEDEKFSQIRNKKCICCGIPMYRHGTYKRFAAIGGKKVRVLVARFYCRVCKKKCSALPSFLRAYSIIPEVVVEFVREQYQRYGQSIRSLARELGFARTTIR